MGLRDRTRRAGPLCVAMVVVLALAGCGVARVGNATLGEVGVAGSLTGQGGHVVGEGSAVDHSTGAELGGVRVWLNFPAVVTSAMRWVADLVGGEAAPNPDVGTLVPIEAPNRTRTEAG